MSPLHKQKLTPWKQNSQLKTHMKEVKISPCINVSTLQLEVEECLLVNDLLLTSSYSLILHLPFNYKTEMKIVKKELHCNEMLTRTYN